MSTTYLVTGANRGLGLGLVTSLLKRPNTTVIAAARNPASAENLTRLPTASGSKAIVVKIDSQNHTDAAHAVAEIQSKHGITKLDVVIANAGISDHYALAVDTSLSEAQRHYEVNFLAPLALFQATLPLLQKSANPKFVGISTGVASISSQEKLVALKTTAYGSSKIALNFFLKRVHLENPDIIAYPLNPGWVQTDMGNKGAASAGLEKAPVTLDDSVASILKNIDGATREQTSGTFQSADSETYSW